MYEKNVVEGSCPHRNIFVIVSSEGGEGQNGVAMGIRGGIDERSARKIHSLLHYSLCELGLKHSLKY